MSEKNEKPRVGIVCVGQLGERVDLAEQFFQTAVKGLNCSGADVVCGAYSCTVSAGEVKEDTSACIRQGADVVVYLIGTWLLTSHVIDAAGLAAVPVGIWGIPEPVSFSSVGANAVHGTLDEMGFFHELFYGFPDDLYVTRKIRQFATAGQIKRNLRNARLGLIGGRAISAYPTSADPNQIKEKFGVEVEHIDQLVLLEKARQVPQEKTAKIAAWLRKVYRSVDVPEDVLCRSVNIYVVLKQIIEEYGLTMCSVKCLGEFMDHYASCCLAVSLLNDEDYLVGCQCNINAMLSSYILRFLTDAPVYFGDINTVQISEKTARVINCGGTPGRLARSYQDIDIVSQYDYMGKGGGACTLFCLRPGDVTFGTLGRIHGRYVMSIAQGQAFEEPLDKLRAVRSWAQGFVKLDCNMETFYKNIRSNHSTFCYGHVGEELKEICRVLGIEALIN